EATNVLTGVTRQVTADARGVFLFTDLQPGTYKVTVSVANFATNVTDNVRVDANVVRRVDATLRVGKATETVTVTGAPPELQTDRRTFRFELGSDRKSPHKLQPRAQFPSSLQNHSWFRVADGGKFGG